MMIIFKIRFLSVCERRSALTNNQENNHFQNYKLSLDCKCVTTINKGYVYQDQNNCIDLL